MFSQAAHATTILAVRRPEALVLASDGQVSLGNTVLKHKANKLRRLAEGRIVAGFAGATADAFTLFERFDVKLRDNSNNLVRAAVELTKEWRTDRMLRRLEAMLLVADESRTLLLSGTGDVVEPDHPTVSIGSGAPMAASAARALFEETQMSAEAIVRASMRIAADTCIYTNHQLNLEILPTREKMYHGDDT